MTIATIWKKDFVTRILVEGHSNYKSFGKDIVCSSISTATIFTANLVTKLTKCCHIDYNEKEVSIDIQITDGASKEVYTVMSCLQETLEDIQTQYPNNLIIKYK